MTYEQKFEAIKGLAPAHLEMREAGNWYVAQNRTHIRERSFITSFGATGKTPEDAINKYWEEAIKQDCILLDMSAEYGYRWNGFMWERVRDRLYRG